MANSIIAPTPTQNDPKDQTELRKALTDLTQGINTSINALQNNSNLVQQWIPYPAGNYNFPSGIQTISSGGFPVGAQTTAPTFGNGTTKKGWYKTYGKLMDIKFTISQFSATGTVPGSGIYLIPFPIGVTADQNYQDMLTTTDTGSSIGTCKVAFFDGTNDNVGVAHATLNTSTLICFLANFISSSGAAAGGKLWSSTFSLFNGSPVFNISGILIGIPIL